MDMFGETDPAEEGKDEPDEPVAPKDAKKTGEDKPKPDKKKKVEK